MKISIPGIFIFIAIYCLFLILSGCKSDNFCGNHKSVIINFTHDRMTAGDQISIQIEYDIKSFESLIQFLKRNNITDVGLSINRIKRPDSELYILYDILEKNNINYTIIDHFSSVR